MNGARIVFGRLVLSKFDSMPEWARLCAFFVALFVLVIVSLHSVGAKYFVTGTVLEPSPAHPGFNQVARGYDVRSWAISMPARTAKVTMSSCYRLLNILRC
jgi:hypothetical protein